MGPLDEVRSAVGEVIADLERELAGTACCCGVGALSRRGRCCHWLRWR